MIAIIRHGEAEKAEGRAIGKTDLPLSLPGKKQAEKIAECLRAVPFSSLYTSPLTRTLQTARVIKKHCSISPIECCELQEINLGEWDGLNFAQIKKNFPHEYALRGKNIAKFRPPGGENFAELKLRAMRQLDEISKNNLPAIVVTHAGIIRVVLSAILDFPLNNIFKIKPEHCHVTLISQSSTSTTCGFKLEGFNLPASKELTSFLQDRIS